MSANPPLTQLLREAEAAGRLGTSVRTLQKWRCNGRDPGSSGYPDPSGMTPRTWMRSSRLAAEHRHLTGGRG
jgi:hypothetical protein